MRIVAARKIKFQCGQCGTDTEANIGTKREEKQLCKECFGKKTDSRVNVLNELTGSEWAKNSKSVETYPDIRSEKQKQHGACFPKNLAKQQIEIYTKINDVVLDPFMGVGTTADAAIDLKRRVIGIELNPTFAEMCRNSIIGQGLDERATLFQGDCERELDKVQTETVDFVLTSPPYANLLRNVKGNFAYKWREHSDINPIQNPRPYSEYEDDIGNMDYADGLEKIREILRKCYRVQKNNTYAAWVVKDFRDLKHNIPYINFHGDVIECALSVGYVLWDIRIYDQTAFRTLVCLGYPSRNYYLNIGHSYILIFKKVGR